MNEGLNAVTLVDGEYPTTTPYILATDIQKAAVAGFIVQTAGEPGRYRRNATERERLHPVYGDFPRLRSGGPVPAKPALLGDVDDEAYEHFVRDITEALRRDDVATSACAAVCVPPFVAGLVLSNEDVGKYLVVGAIVAAVIGTLYYEVYTKRRVVQGYKPIFAGYGIEVVEVSFTSDYYTPLYNHEGSTRDRSTYVVFSKAGSWERVAGERQFHFLRKKSEEEGSSV